MPERQFVKYTFLKVDPAWRRLDPAEREVHKREVIAACERPHSAAELLPIMFRRPLDQHQTAFALGEALAHLHYLAGQGEIERASGEDGIDRFLRKAA